MTAPTIDSSAARPHLDDLLEGVLDIVGRHARVLEALLTVSRVEWSDEVATACIECVERPRLRLNPAFVAQRCKTPERLAMLVLHELLHVTLGHTRLFPRPTRVHNIAFDALVNRVALSMLEGSGAVVHRHAELLEAVYAANETPWFILRPPPGWPDAPEWQHSRGAPHALRRIHRQLYAPHVGKEALHLTLTYGELVEALRGTAPPEADAAGGEHPPLLGAHGTTEAECEALAGTRDADMADLLSNALDALRGMLPGAGDELHRATVRDVRGTPTLERALRVLLRRAAHANGASARRFEWHAEPRRTVLRLHDRRAACRVFAAQQLGAPSPLLFDGEQWKRRAVPLGLVIYVDVSGSMDQLLPHLRRALRSLRGEVQPVIHWFSTRVVTARPGELESGRVPTTGGTSIASVLAHIVREVPARTPVVVLTDGFLEQVPPRTAAPVRTHGSQVHLGVIGAGPLHEGAPWVTTSTRLPLASEVR